MRGFLGTAAAMVFVFSLVTAMYTFMLVSPDLSGSARAGLAIESARWAVEADNFQCNNPAYDGSTYETATKAGIIVTDGNSDLTYPTDFAGLTIDLVRDYNPGALLESTGADLTWQCCDDNLVSTCGLYQNGVLVAVSPPHSDPTSGTYYVKATDNNGNIGYSNTITV